MNSAERVFTMFKGQETDHLPLMPITMQLAGDFAGIRYGEYVKDYRKLVTGQIKIAEEFDFDHVSCISDPTREAHDMGAKILFYEDAPPAIDNNENLLKDKSKLASLKIADVLGGGRMHDRVRAAELFNEEVGKDKVIEGWVEGPCAEGADLRGITALMMDFYEDPGFVGDLFEFCVQQGIEFAKYQIEAGVDVIGIGDAVCSLIGPTFYEEFVWSYEKELIDAIHEMGAAVRLHICGDIRSLLSGIGRLGCELVDLDHMVPVAQARGEMGAGQVLSGNIDPVSVLQDSDPKEIYEAVGRCHRESGDKYVVNAGCEITRTTAFENIRAMTEYAKGH